MKTTLQNTATAKGGTGFVIRTMRVTHTEDRFTFGEGGISIGRLVDETIDHAIQKGETITELTVSFTEEDWRTLVQRNF